MGLKRPGRCVGKYSFSYLTKAQGQVRKNYVWWLRSKWGKPALGIYECPTCLEFHTTSKYSNMSNGERWHCLDFVCGVKFPRTGDLIKQRMELIAI